MKKMTIFKRLAAAVIMLAVTLPFAGVRAAAEEGTYPPYFFGLENGLFEPDTPLLRHQAAILFYNLLKDGSETGLDILDRYGDVEASEEYAEAVAFVTRHGIMQGYAGLFDPDGEVTRAQMARMLYQLKLRPDEGSVVAFNDVGSSWALTEIERMAALRVINGYGDGTFRPENTVSRAEAVAMINRYFKREGEYIAGSVIPDVPESHWAYAHVMAAVNGMKSQEVFYCLGAGVISSQGAEYGAVKADGDRFLAAGGQSVTFKAVPAEGMVFIGWTARDSRSAEIISSSAEYTVEVDGNAFIYAVFDRDGSSEDNAAEIYSAADLIRIGANEANLGKCYKLMNDIDLNPEGSVYWNPIGSEKYPFTGVFDGCGYTVKNLTIQSGGDYAGLFGTVSGDKSVIKRLKMADIGIFGKKYAGGIAARLTYGAVISDCEVSGYVTSTVSGGYAGLISGYNYEKSRVIYCKTSGSVAAVGDNSYTGGISGASVYEAVIASCASEAEVWASGSGSSAGGIVGIQTRSNVQDCYANGSVKAVFAAGGIAGYNDYGTLILRCYATGSISADERAGGIAGYNDNGNIRYCAAMNSGVEAASTGRITGENTTVSERLVNNIAFEDLGGAAWLNVGYDDIDGLGIPQSDFLSPHAFYELFGPFDYDSDSLWVWDEDISMPVLRVFAG